MRRGAFKLWILITISYCWQHAYFISLLPKTLCVLICTKQTFICSKWEILEIEIKNKITITTSFWYVEFEHVFTIYTFCGNLLLILLHLINISTSIVIGFWRHYEAIICFHYLNREWQKWQNPHYTKKLLPLQNL